VTGGWDGRWYSCRSIAAIKRTGDELGDDRLNEKVSTGPVLADAIKARCVNGKIGPHRVAVAARSLR
jgi:hypothetical protein